MEKTYTIYVDTYIKTIGGQFKPAGRDHAIEYKVNASDEVNALIVFRQNHPTLMVGACEEDIAAQTSQLFTAQAILHSQQTINAQQQAGILAQAQAWHQVVPQSTRLQDALVYGLGAVQSDKTLGGAWDKLK